MSAPAKTGSPTTKAAPAKVAATAATRSARSTSARVGASASANEARTIKKATGALFLVRIRGTVHVTGKTKDTLDMLHLTRPNHATVIPNTESYLGMVNRVKDYVAYGDIDGDTLAALIKSRGRLMGDKPIDDAVIKGSTDNKYATVDAFAKAVAKGEATIKQLGEDVKPVFRLTPPRGGHKGSTKRHYTVKGELGYRGKEINELVKRMM